MEDVLLEAIQLDYFLIFKILSFFFGFIGRYFLPLHQRIVRLELFEANGALSWLFGVGHDG